MRVIFIHGAQALKESWGDVPQKSCLDENGNETDFQAEAPKDYGDAPMLKDSADRVIAELRAIANNTGDACILVGHSHGGMIISEVTAREDRPDNIIKLVYITALLPRPGESAKQLLRNDLKLGVGVLWNLSQFSAEQKRLFRSVTNKAKPNFSTPFSRSAKFEEIPKVFITCRKDRVIPYSGRISRPWDRARTQKQMISRANNIQVIDDLDTPSRDTGHFPMIQKPDDLARVLYKAYNL